jgi:hypothetical protein
LHKTERKVGGPPVQRATSIRCCARLLCLDAIGSLYSHCSNWCLCIWKVVSTSYLARGELHGPVLVVLGEDAGVEHGRVCRVGAVPAAQHAEGQLGVIHHRRHGEARGPEPPPVRPRALHPLLRGHRGRREFLRIGRSAGAEARGGRRHGGARV